MDVLRRRNELADQTFHVIPLNDLKHHSEAVSCACRPRVEHAERGKIVIHNAYDGREFHEESAEQGH